MTTGTGVPCGRPGCAGQLEDGYCDSCGLAPAPSPPAPSPPTPADVLPATNAAAVGTTGSRASRRGSTRTSTTGSSRNRLGAGLVDVPSVPHVDPATALLVDPQVAEDKRFCSRCGHPVGRSRDGRPGRVEGFCPHDGARFSFAPTLAPGVLVAGQYEVAGCLAHGGLGWIYLAVDRNVSDRWVVLKGLLDSGDADAMAAAVAERRFLAQVSHPNIVTIHNFVQHPGGDGSPVGYIVMEYVGGSSLKQLLEARRRANGGIEPFPVAAAIVYALETLPALGYLHANGLAYCDFKPDNVIQYGRQLKLIDLGAVIRMDDQVSAVYGTIGYQAPEIAVDGPSPSSDLFTVGRALAVLSLGMPPARRGTPVELPDTAGHPVLAAHESFHRLLRRAVDPDPLRRFGSADEMADQLTGVLHDVLATEGRPPPPSVSAVFGPPRGAFGSGLLAGASGSGRPVPAAVADVLALPLVDPADPAAGVLATLSTTDPDEVANLMAAAPKPSLELRLRLVRAHLEAGDPPAATACLDALAAEESNAGTGAAGTGAAEPGDWRIVWFRGVTALVAGDAAAAGAAFDTVYSTLPGETAPKLALAATAECAGGDELAGRYYTLVARRDPGVTDAAFGLARVSLRAGRRGAALAALDAVPESSSQYVPAQLSAVRAALVGASDARVAEDELRAAAARVERVSLTPATDHEIRATLLTCAVDLVSGPVPPRGAPLLGCPWQERDLRLALEAELRAAARLAVDPSERVALVDRANAVHPRTWV